MKMGMGASMGASQSSATVRASVFAMSDYSIKQNTEDASGHMTSGVLGLGTNFQNSDYTINISFKPLGDPYGVEWTVFSIGEIDASGNTCLDFGIIGIGGNRHMYVRTKYGGVSSTDFQFSGTPIGGTPPFLTGNLNTGKWYDLWWVLEKSGFGQAIPKMYCRVAGRSEGSQAPLTDVSPGGLPTHITSALAPSPPSLQQARVGWGSYTSGWRPANTYGAIGKIDNIRCWDASFAIEDMAVLSQSGAVRAGLGSNLLAHWKLDDGLSSTQSVDSSGNGHTLTLSGDYDWDKVGYGEHTW